MSAKESPAATTNSKGTTHRAALQKAFAMWMKHPTSERLYGSLRDAMTDHELRARLVQAIPNSPGN